MLPDSIRAGNGLDSSNSLLNPLAGDRLVLRRLNHTILLVGQNRGDCPAFSDDADLYDLLIALFALTLVGASLVRAVRRRFAEGRT
jgi:hypothetical protein